MVQATALLARETAPPPPALIRGHQALARGDWSTACAALLQADGQIELETGDLGALADAAMYCGEHDISIEARQRAFARHLGSGDRPRAAKDALWLVINHVVRLRFAVAAGWLHKARRLLGGLDASVEAGYAHAVTALFSLATGALQDAHDSGKAAFDAGARHADADLEAIGLMLRGVALVRIGDIAAAIPLLDEAMATASSGGLGPFATGLIYCRTLCAYVDLHEYQRAGEWLASIRPGLVESAEPGFPGDCRAHQADLLLVTGDWEAAERTARVACAQAQTFDLLHAGMAYRAIGGVRLRRGDLDGAHEALVRARCLQVSPQPDMALLLLARGDAEAARASLDVALAEAVDPLERARLLPASVEIALATGDTQVACARAAELAALAAEYGSTALAAAAAHADGCCLSALEKAGAAARLREAISAWQKVSAPYEVARSSLALATVLGTNGDLDAARQLARDAASTFGELGARPAREHAERLAASLGSSGR